MKYSLLCTMLIMALVTIGLETQELKNTQKQLELKQEQLDEIPEYLIRAYNKCSTEHWSDEFERHCIAFEIKELNH